MTNFHQGVEAHGLTPTKDHLNFFTDSDLPSLGLVGLFVAEVAVAFLVFHCFHELILDYHILLLRQLKHSTDVHQLLVDNKSTVKRVHGAYFVLEQRQKNKEHPCNYLFTALELEYLSFVRFHVHKYDAINELAEVEEYEPQPYKEHEVLLVRPLRNVDDLDILNRISHGVDELKGDVLEDLPHLGWISLLYGVAEPVDSYPVNELCQSDADSDHDHIEIDIRSVLQ
mmetsp:Transcript_23093/g.35766  ORF Transcript_23093/g.35766 Transcript_23093/m.35766 type:complete len:227 (-) Transcript_23093:536-1216(-)